MGGPPEEEPAAAALPVPELIPGLQAECAALTSSVAALLESLRVGLAASVASTAEHLALHQAAAERASGEATAAADAVFGLMDATTQLAHQLPALQSLAAQARALRLRLEALEAAADKAGLPPLPARTGF